MGNPFTFVFRHVKAYAKDLRNAPAAQYVTSAAAPSVALNLATVPPPAYVSKEKYLGDSDDSRPSTGWSANVPTIVDTQPEFTVSKLVPTKTKKGVFDKVTELAGSRWVFAFAMSLLVTWAVLGIVYGPTDTWQVMLQDVSSLQCYMSATLLMRQQQNMTRSLLGQICGLISRSENLEAMARRLTPAQMKQLRRSHRASRPMSAILTAPAVKESLFDRIANTVSAALGSLTAIIGYWLGILVWVFFGIPLQFTDTWQLYVNTATAIELTITTVFLQGVRRQHEEHLAKCLAELERVDAGLEMELRRLTGSTEANPVVASRPMSLSRIEKIIDVWAFVVGGSVGVFISVAVFVIWAAVGNMLEFDDNWWLIIGTYTGLVGFIDGFVLRNVHHRETAMAAAHFSWLADQDARLFALLDAPVPEDPNPPRKPTLSARVSTAIDKGCAHRFSSLGAFSTVIGLLIIASAMQWTETGQLLCNTPTMIVEGFLLLMLIQAHNGADSRSRKQWSDVLRRRLALERRVVVGRGEKKGEWVLDIDFEHTKGGLGLIWDDKKMTVTEYELDGPETPVLDEKRKFEDMV